VKKIPKWLVVVIARPVVIVIFASFVGLCFYWLGMPPDSTGTIVLKLLILLGFCVWSWDKIPKLVWRVLRK
jgi:hypothetical protein